MSGYVPSSSALTAPAPPTTAQVAVRIMASMQAGSGVVTDFNPGSNIRTYSESMGSVMEIEGISAQALVFQSMIYGTYAAFGIVPESQTYAGVSLVFATSFGANPPPVTSSVTIPGGTGGTIVSTAAGIQFLVSETVVIPAGSSSVTVPAIAVQPGLTGNVGADTIVNILTPLTYPLVVNNPASASGGLNAETPSQTLARFMAKVAALGLGSPVAIANAVIGVSTSTGETVAQAAVYEPWIVTSGAPAGFDVYIDNGSGSASSSLIQAVTSFLNGNLTTGELGNRPAGVPYSVQAVVPLYCNVVITGTLPTSALISSLTTSISNNITAFFQEIQFGETVYQTSLVALVANVAGAYVTALSVTLEDSNGNPVSSISALDYERIILNQLTVTLTS
jgi:uncharacterized phage protein gp47/JayE